MQNDYAFMRNLLGDALTAFPFRDAFKAGAGASFVWCECLIICLILKHDYYNLCRIIVPK